MAFNSVPSKATLKLEPFKAQVSDDELTAFQTLLKYSKIGPKTFENLTTDPKDYTSWGIKREWLADAKNQWENHYDWRKTEARINSYPNYTTEIDSGGDVYKVHFIAYFSKKQDAAPLLLLHGWPGTFLEFLGTLDVLKSKYDENSLPFHVIVPSLPGYGYSSGPPLDKDSTVETMAKVLDKLMIGLGFEDGYISQGGDIGSFLTRVLAATSPSCKAAHINLSIGVMPDEDEMKSLTSEKDKKAIQRCMDFGNLGNAYAREHGTRPATIGLVLSASPVALLAWVGEKFLQWTDESPPVHDILESVTLYWFTDSFPRAIHPYRQFFGPAPTFFHNDPKYFFKKPFGYSWHPEELGPVPTSLVAKTGNMVWSRDHDEGGHFAAMEKPKMFVQDMEDFVKEVWPKAKQGDASIPVR